MDLAAMKAVEIWMRFGKLPEMTVISTKESKEFVPIVAILFWSLATKLLRQMVIVVAVVIVRFGSGFSS